MINAYTREHHFSKTYQWFGFRSSTISILAGDADPELDAIGGFFKVTRLPEVDLSIQKSSTPDPVIAGDQITYEITVTSNSLLGATNVIVEDLLPPPLAYESGSSDPSCSEIGGTVTCDVGDLGAGDSVSLTIAGTVDATFAGTITNTATVSADNGDPDPSNNTATVDTKVLSPNVAPECFESNPSQDTIWPPNHKFVPINLLGVTDPDGDLLSVTIDGIWQDEPVDTYGDGSFTPDGQGVRTDTAEVRAERAGTKKVPGNGRVYHVFFTADDGQGGSCSGELLVGVPHDQGQGSVPADDGALYDSTIP